MSEPATKIVLHIGAEKTGTSSLQATLAKNAATLLAEAGLLYPREVPLAAGNAHFGVAAAFLDPRRTEFFLPGGHRSPAELRQALAAAIVRERPRLAVLSAEHFSSRFERPQIEALARFLAPHTIEIVYYARRQDEMSASSFGTGLLYGRRDWFDSEAIRPDWRFFDHCRILDEWAAIFGAGRLRVRNYGDFAEAGLVEDFLAQAGLSTLPALAAAERLNRSITIREAQFLLALNQHLPTWDEASAGKGGEAYWAAGHDRQRLLALLRQNPTLPDSPPVTALIGEAESATIMARFAETNARLAEKYGVVFAQRRNGPQMAVRLEPLEPALVEFLAVQLREIERRDIAIARGKKSGLVAKLGASMRQILRRRQ
jgi:hypothetical protein